MGYTLEIYALSLPDLVEQLRRPTLDPAAVQVDPQDPGMVDVLTRWPSLAWAVAEAAGAGGGTVTEELAGYVVAVVRHLGHHATALSHTSSGGEELREDVLGRQAAPLLGRGFLAGLLSRELAGLVVLDVPSLGWADAAEVQLAARTAAAAEPADDSSEDVWRLVDAVELAARRGQDLVGLYL